MRKLYIVRALIVLVFVGLFLLRNLFHSHRSSELTPVQAEERRNHVALIEQQRQARLTKEQAELKECQTKAAQLSAEITSQRTGLKPDDLPAQALVKEKEVQYNAVLLRIKAIEVEVENAYYATAAPANSARRIPGEKAALLYADEDLLELESEPVNVRNRISETTDPLLAAGDFAKLDEIAAGFRKSKIQCANGAWHLELFYNGFAMLPDYLPESAWSDRIAILEKWIKQSPESITPRVALAGVWCEWGFRARGGDYASEVSRKGWQLLRERLDQAAKVLGEARTLNEKCPTWWAVAQRLALGQNWSRSNYEKIFDEAIRFDPLYTGFYTNKNNYLLPRWYGKPNERAAFAEAAADQVGGEEGDILYARLVWRLHAMDMFPTGSIVDEAGASWPRVRKGLEAIVLLHPQSIAAASELCYLCCQHGEHERMRQLFIQIGPLVDTTIYGDNRRFLQDRRVAFR